MCILSRCVCWLVSALVLSCSLGASATHESSTATALSAPTNSAHVISDVIQARLGAENSWPPYSDEHGQGISIELIKAAFAKTGIAPHFQVLPYARVLHDLDSGKIDGGFNISRQSTTEERFLFGDVPLIHVEAYWFFLPGTHNNIQSIKDIPDHFRVGVIRDYEYGDEYENQRHRFNEIKVSQQSQIIRMLKQGRIDAAIMFKDEANSAMQKMRLKSETFDRRFLNHHGAVYLAFSHKSPRARWLAQQFDKGLLMMKESGEYDEILSRNKNAP
jgi:polar amino acid transport system substrate-binding protein